MHYLQKIILDKLRYIPPLRYTALMPDGIESSHFRYHLKLLITAGFVNKSADGLYTLSDKGQREVDYHSDNRTTIIRLPKVITYTLLMCGDDLLLYKKAKEPYKGLLGLVGGKLHFGEDAQDAAAREIYEKTDLHIAPPSHCGTADILIYKDNEPLSHVVAHVYKADVAGLLDASGALPSLLVQVGSEELNSYAVIPDLLPLLKHINEGAFPFTERLRCQL
jgi:ADP-ribose pyrophosphatase YjhB (NUDIX family)